MTLNANGPLWPEMKADTPQRPRFLLRLPRWIELPAGVEAKDLRVEERNGELVLIAPRR